MAAGGKTGKIANFLNSEWIVMYDSLFSSSWKNKKQYPWIFIIGVIFNLTLAPESPEDDSSQGSNQYKRLYP